MEGVDKKKKFKGVDRKDKYVKYLLHLEPAVQTNAILSSDLQSS